jgi:type VI secretion system protein
VTAANHPRGPFRRAHRGEREAVLAHLQALLDTRRGESLSAPGLGVVEFADIVHSFPAGAQALAHAIRVAIARHEPRLVGVVVQPVAADDPLCLAFEISARLAGDARREPLRARADLSASGCFKVHVP